MIISRSNNCPYCGDEHSNSCFVVYDDGHKCFSCGHTFKHSTDFYAFRPDTGFKPIVKDLGEVEYNPNKFSNKVLEWLYTYYVYDSDIKKFFIGWIQTSTAYNESLIFHIDCENYQRRFFPKAFYSTLDMHKIIFQPNTEGECIVLVEDFISCIRLSKFIPCICLFGTSLKSPQLQYILKNFSYIYIWMDGDEPGIKASNNIVKQLSKTFNNKVKYTPLLYKSLYIEEILKDFSPKEVCDETIKNVLGEVCLSNTIHNRTY